MRKEYLVKRIIRYMSVLIVLLVCVLATFAFSSFSVLGDDLAQEASGILQVYGSTLQNRLVQMDGVLQNLLLQNYNNSTNPEKRQRNQPFLRFAGYSQLYFGCRVKRHGRGRAGGGG